MGSLLDIILGKMGALGGPSKAKSSSSKKVRSLRSRKKHSKVQYHEGKPREASSPRAGRVAKIGKSAQTSGGSIKKKKG